MVKDVGLIISKSTAHVGDGFVGLKPEPMGGGGGGGGGGGVDVEPVDMT